jgi:hypothetical protein
LTAPLGVSGDSEGQEVGAEVALLVGRTLVVKVGAEVGRVTVEVLVAVAVVVVVVVVTVAVAVAVAVALEVVDEVAVAVAVEVAEEVVVGLAEEEEVVGSEPEEVPSQTAGPGMG